MILLQQSMLRSMDAVVAVLSRYQPRLVRWPWCLSALFRPGETSVHIFVRNLPFTVSKRELYALFTPYGVVARVTILTDPTTGRSRGCGLVEMPNPWATLDAMRWLQGIVLEGCPLMITLA